MAKDARDPRKVAAVRKARTAKQSDTSKKLAIAIQLHPRSHFAREVDYNKYKKLIQGGYSARSAWREYIIHLEGVSDDVLEPNDRGAYPGESGPTLWESI